MQAPLYRAFIESYEDLERFIEVPDGCRLREVNYANLALSSTPVTFPLRVVRLEPWQSIPVPREPGVIVRTVECYQDNFRRIRCIATPLTPTELLVQ